MREESSIIGSLYGVSEVSPKKYENNSQGKRRVPYFLMKKRSFEKSRVGADIFFLLNLMKKRKLCFIAKLVSFLIFKIGQ